MEFVMKPKLAMIGAGSIATSHIEAAQAAGFELHGICGRPNSQKALELTKKYGFVNYFSDIESMLKSKFDAISLISKTESLAPIYSAIEKLDLPVLVEKPFSTNLSTYDEIKLDNPKTLIGYNRRYYSSIKKLKEKLIEFDYHHAILHISEISWNSNALLNEQIECLYENSVHSFDLLRYLFGDCNVRNITKNFKYNSLKSILINIETNSKKTIDLSISFGIPLNTYIEVWFEDTVAICKPLENYSEYKEMQMFAPNQNIKYKRYVPKKIENWSLSKDDSNFKPGFMRQYQDFKNITSGLKSEIGAKLTDAKIATAFAAKIANA